MSKPKQNPFSGEPQNAAIGRPRLVCTECGSPEIVEVRHGYTRTTIAFYADGDSELLDCDEETTDLWLECEACCEETPYEELVAEAS
jgi:hypothetical protein